MFVRVKKAGPYRYVQIVRNHREGKRWGGRPLPTASIRAKVAACRSTLKEGGIHVLSMRHS